MPEHRSHLSKTAIVIKSTEELLIRSNFILPKNGAGFLPPQKNASSYITYLVRRDRRNLKRLQLTSFPYLGVFLLTAFLNDFPLKMRMRKTHPHFQGKDQGISCMTRSPTATLTVNSTSDVLEVLESIRPSLLVYPAGSCFPAAPILACKIK